MKTKLFTMLVSVIGISGMATAQLNAIGSQGNVGIGTSAPQGKLDVRGDVIIDSTLKVRKKIIAGDGIDAYNLSTMKKLEVINNLSNSGETQFYGAVSMPNLQQSTGSTTTQVVLQDSLGTLITGSWDLLLHKVYDDKSCDPLLYNYQAPTWANGPNKVFLGCPQVFVGIGTKNPKVELDVEGTTRTSRISINSDPMQMGAKLFHLKANYPSSALASATLFLIENHERALFQVNNDGVVRSREIIVNLQQAWPDYVFKPDYELTPLNQVEEFITKNGHLPNVPSAEVVEKDGVELGEMNRILLEKVEELTLHLIEQQKMLQAQAARISALETDKK